MTSVSNGSKQSEEESLLNSEMQSAVSTVNYNEVTKDDNNDTDHGRDVSEDKKLAQLYQAAKDENELLEFKNYELLFKIQELEQNQKKILKKLVVADCNVPACNSDKQQPENKENEVKFEIVGHDSRLTSSKIKHDFNNHDPYLKNQSQQQLQLQQLQLGGSPTKETLQPTRTPTTNSSPDFAVKKKSSDLLLLSMAGSSNNGLIDGTIRAGKINDHNQAGNAKEDEEEEEEEEEAVEQDGEKLGQQVAPAAKWNQRQRQQAHLRLTSSSASLLESYELALREDEYGDESAASVSLALSNPATTSSGARSEALGASSAATSNSGQQRQQVELSNRSADNGNLNDELLLARTQLVALLEASEGFDSCNSSQRDALTTSVSKLNATSPQQSEKSSANHLGHENMNQQKPKWIDYSLGARKTNKRQICGSHDMHFEANGCNGEIDSDVDANTNANGTSQLSPAIGTEDDTTKPHLGSLAHAIDAPVATSQAASTSQPWHNLKQLQLQQVICGNSTASMNLDEVQKLIEYNGERTAMTPQSCSGSDSVVAVERREQELAQVKQLWQQVGGSNEPQQLPLITSNSNSSKTTLWKPEETKVMTGPEITTDMDNTNEDQPKESCCKLFQLDNEENTANCSYFYNRSDIDCHQSLSSLSNSFTQQSLSNLMAPSTGYDESSDEFRQSSTESESLPLLEIESNSKRTKQLAMTNKSSSPASSSSQHRKMPNMKNLSQEAKKLAISQPNLSQPLLSQTEPQAAARRSTGNARIAVPVTIKTPSVSSGGKLQQHHQASQQPLSLQSSRAPTGGLRVRSKSSLDQSSLPRRTPTINLGFKQQNLKPSIKSRACSISNVKQLTTTTTSASTSNNHESFSAEQQQHSANNKSAQLSSCLLNTRNRSRSSSSIGFVTQIPTLISHSHASGAPTPTLDSLGATKRGSLLAKQPTSSVATSTSTPTNWSSLDTRKAMSGHSKSMSNLVSGNFRCSTTTGTAPVTTSVQQGKTSNGQTSAADENELTSLKLGVAAACSKQQELEQEKEKESNLEGERSKRMESDRTGCAKIKMATRSLLPKAPSAKGKSLSLHCVSMINGPDESLDGSIVDVSRLDDHQQEEKGTSGSEQKKPPSAMCVVNGQQEDVATTGITLRASQENNKPTADNNCNNSGYQQQQQQEQQQEQQQCSQCKLLQSKVNLLIKDRKQLNEQINELEEMENDSRLMSQKLGQQLQLVEQQLESCKLELQKACDSESKLQFQNKKLNFELEEKLQNIGKLQGQLNKLQGKLLLARQQQVENNEASSGKVSCIQSADSIRCSSCKSSSNNNGIDLTRNIDESSSSLKASATGMQTKTAQSNSEAEAKQVAEQHKEVSEDRDNKQQVVERSPVLSASNSDDDSAIEVLDKAGLTNSVQISPVEQRQRTFSDTETSSGQLANMKVANESIKRTSLCDDSAYSKSSASSDANSDDGHRSDYEQVEVQSHGFASADSSATLKEEKALMIESGGVVKSSRVGADAGGDIKGNDLHTNIASSSSSGDESDHHESQLAIGNQLCLSLASNNSSIQVGVEQREQSREVIATSSNQQQQVGNSNNNSALTSRQQVLRKKISTARILRGIQVQQQQARSGSPTSSNRSQEQQLVECGSNEHSAATSSLLGQARFAQVVPEVSTTKLNDQSTTSACDGETKQDRPISNVSKESTQTNNERKSPIDLALRGVEQLEQGSQTDEALRSLIGDSRKHIQIKGNSNKAAASDYNESEVVPVAASNLINQFKLEISSLKMRLMQAHTLNDNLVSELKSNKDRLDQLAKQLSSQHVTTQQQQLGHHQSQVELEPLRRRSVVYMNGYRTATTQEQQQQTQASCMSNNGSFNHQSYPAPLDNSQHNRQPQVPHRTACVSQAELLDFLRFLLDKVHFHHGRTFELVNECQKLAMDALLASYSHQMNLVHHNSAVMAANEAAARRVAAPEVSGQHQYFQHQPQQTAFDGVYPVRPPPRRRNAANRMMPVERQADQSAGSSICKSGELAQVEFAASNRSSALQVAKQTLFSIVPIYYSNSNSNTNTNSNSNNNINNTCATSGNNNFRAFDGKNNKETKENKQQSCESLNFDNVKSENNNNNKNNNSTGHGNANSTKLSAILNSPSSSIKRLHAKSKSWIVLNPSKTNKQEADYANLDTNRSLQQQHNVSVLEINRTTIGSSGQNIGRILPNEQHSYQAHPLVQPTQQPTTVANSQHLYEAKSSLSEDIERYRVRFNGQLLDLLTRQNWCESIISEKIRIYQALDQSQACRTVFTSTSESRFRLMSSEPSGAKCINGLASRQSTSVPTIVNSISFNPNGSALHQHQQQHHQHQQLYQTNLHSRLNQAQQQGASSFC